MQYLEFVVDWDIDNIDISQFFRQRKLWIPGAWNHLPFPAQLGVLKNSGQNKWRLDLDLTWQWQNRKRQNGGKVQWWLRSASNECCHACSAMVMARLEMVSGQSDSQYRLLGFDAKYFQVHWNNDCWGWPSQWWRGGQLWWTWRCRLIFCKCLQTSTVCWQVYILELRDLLGDGLSMLRSMPELHHARSRSRGTELKKPKSSFRNSKWTSSGISRNAERVVFQIWGTLCCPSCWGQTSRSMESKPRDTAFNDVDW